MSKISKCPLLEITEDSSLYSVPTTVYHWIHSSFFYLLWYHNYNMMSLHNDDFTTCFIWILSLGLQVTSIFLVPNIWYILSLQFRPKRGLGLYLSYKKQLSKNSDIGLTLNTQESISLMLASVGVRSEPQQVCLGIHTLCRRSVLRVGILKQVHRGPNTVLEKIIFSFIIF